MKVMINSASSGLHEYEVKSFDNWKDLIDFMRKDYQQWVINFGRKNTELFPEDNPERAEKIDFAITKYNDYLE